MANTENTKPLANGTLRLFCVTAEPLKEYRKSQQRLQEYLRKRELLHRERELKWQRQQEQREKEKMNKEKLQEISQSKKALEQENENAKTSNSPHNSLVSVALSKLLPSGFLDKDKDKEVSRVRSPHKQQEHEQNEDKEKTEKKISVNEFAQSEVRVGDDMNAPHLLEEEEEESMEKEVDKEAKEKEEEHAQESNLLQEAKMDNKNKMEIESNKLENVVNVITPYGPADKVLSLSTTPSPVASPAALSSVPILGASETTEAKLQELVKSHKTAKESEEQQTELRNLYDMTNNKKRNKAHVTDAMFDQEMEVRRRSTRHQPEGKNNEYKRQKKEEEEEEKEKEKYLQSYFNGPNYYNRNYGTEMHQDRFQRNNNIYDNKNNEQEFYKINDDNEEDDVLNDCNDIFCMERVRVNVSELQWRCAEEQYLEEHGKSNELCLWYPATIVHVIDETSPLYRFMEMSRNGVSLDSDNESISELSEADDDVNESEEEEQLLEKEQKEARKKNKVNNKVHKSREDDKKHYPLLLPSEFSRKVNHRHVHTRQNDSASLLSRRFQIIAVFNATEMETGATIMATHSYITTDIIAHYKFSNKLVHMHPLGLDVELDYHYFNALLPISAQESSTSNSSDTSSLPPTREEQQEQEHYDDNDDESEWKTQRVKRHEGNDTTITTKSKKH